MARCERLAPRIRSRQKDDASAWERIGRGGEEITAKGHDHRGDGELERARCSRDVHLEEERAVQREQEARERVG